MNFQLTEVQATQCEKNITLRECQRKLGITKEDRFVSCKSSFTAKLSFFLDVIKLFRRMKVKFNFGNAYIYFERLEIESPLNNSYVNSYSVV